MAVRRALLVGAGSMGRAWASNLRSCPETELAAWVDLNPQAIVESQEALHFQVDYTGTNLEVALDEVKPDVLIDVTVPEAHCEVTVAALRRGVPVLGEKPMASTMDEARRMVAASRENGTLYMVSQSRRYDPRIAAFREGISHVGRLGILNADFFLGPHFGGFRDAMPSPLLVDMAIHTFDQARFLSGADPVSVYCEEFNPEWSWYSGAASANALFEMTGGLRFAYRGSWCAEGQNTSWEAEWRAVGEAGSVTWDGDHSIQGDLVKAQNGFMSELLPFTESVGLESHTGIAGSLRDFLAALDDPSRTPMARCDDNIKSLAMVFAAVQSAREGRRVEIEPVLAGVEIAAFA